MEEVTLVGDSAGRFCIPADLEVGKEVAPGWELKGRDAAGNPEIGPTELAIEAPAGPAPLEMKLPVPNGPRNLIHFPLGPEDIDAGLSWSAGGVVTHEDGESRQVGPSDFLVCGGKLHLIVDAASGGATFRGWSEYEKVADVEVPPT